MLFSARLDIVIVKYYYLWTLISDQSYIYMRMFVSHSCDQRGGSRIMVQAVSYLSVHPSRIVYTRVCKTYMFDILSDA